MVQMSDVAPPPRKPLLNVAVPFQFRPDSNESVLNGLKRVLSEDEMSSKRVKRDDNEDDSSTANAPHMYNAAEKTDDINDNMVIEAIGAGPVEEEALPPSPVASPTISTPVLSNIDNFDTFEEQSVLLGQVEKLFSGIVTGLSHQSLKNLLFRLLSSTDRTELSDFNLLLSNNLKRDFITSLPLEISLKILQNLEFTDLARCLRVGKQWKQLINDTSDLWKKLLITENFVTAEQFENFEDTLRIKYPGLSNIEEAYRLEFLQSCKYLKNWYNPNFVPQITILRGHITSVITCLQFEDDYVITGADDKIIRVIDAKKKEFLTELRGHDGGVWALQYDEDGILVSGSTDRTVRVWDIKKGRCTHVFKGHASTVRCLDIVKHNGIKYIVTGSRDNTIHVWKLPQSLEFFEDSEETEVYNTPEDNPYFVGALRGHMASVRTVSGYGKLVISGSYDNNLMVWDIEKMKCLYILSGHTDRIYSTVYDHKRNRCISASMDSTIRIWDLENVHNNGHVVNVMNGSIPCLNVMSSLYTLQGHTALVGLLKLSNKFLISAAADGSLRGWDSETYSRKFAYHHDNLSAITTFDMNDNLLVSGSEGQFNIYNLRIGMLIHSNILHDADQIWSVNFKKNLLVAAVERDGQSYVEMLDFGTAASGYTKESIAV